MLIRFIFGDTNLKHQQQICIQLKDLTIFASQSTLNDIFSPLHSSMYTKNTTVSLYSSSPEMKSHMRLVGKNIPHISAPIYVGTYLFGHDFSKLNCDL